MSQIATNKLKTVPGYRVKDALHETVSVLVKTLQVQDTKKNAAPRTLGGLQLTFTGEIAWTQYKWDKVKDGTLEAYVKINLPNIDALAFFSRSEVDTLIGYIVHECGHVFFTDAKSFFEHPRMKSGDGMFAKCVNLLEDPRIERAITSESNIKNAQQCLERLFQTVLQPQYENLKDPNDKSNFFWVSRALCTAALGFKNRTASVLYNQLDHENKLRHGWVANKMKACKSTKDVTKLVEDVLGKLAADQSFGGAGDLSDLKDAVADDTGDGGSGSGGGRGAGQGPTDLNSAVDQFLKQSNEDAAKASKLPGHKKADVNHGGTVVPLIDTSSYTAADYQKIVSEFPGGVGAIKQKLQRLLYAPERNGKFRKQEAGRLDRQALARLCAGQTDVFQKTWHVPGMDTAVTILLDCSSSMQGNNIHYAQQMAVVLSEALHAGRSNFSVLGFTSAGMVDPNAVLSQPKNPARPGANPRRSGANIDSSADSNPETYNANGDTYFRAVGDGYNRPASIFVFKDFDTPLHKAKRELASIHAHPRGGTPDCTAMCYATDLLARRKETRKVLLVLTDGAGNRVIPQTCHRASLLGVEIIGIGCDHDTGKQYPVGVDVFDLSALSKTALGELTRQSDQYNKRRGKSLRRG